MNFVPFFSFVMNMIEKNPALLEKFLESLIHLFVNNPAVLSKAVNVGIAHAEASLPPGSLTPMV